LIDYGHVNVNDNGEITETFHAEWSSVHTSAKVDHLIDVSRGDLLDPVVNVPVMSEANREKGWDEG
jgi:hypothetical protein